MIYYSRINNAKVAELPHRIIPGDLIVMPVGSEQLASLKELLLCDLSGAWRIGDIKGSCDKSACLPEEAEAVLRLGKVAADFSQDMQWKGLLEVDVVDPGWQKDLDPNPLEIAIKDYLPYLRNVFHRPIRHLKVDSETVLISKVRRLAKKAPDHLATHPEDWDGRTVLGIKPKRVLAKVRLEQWDIYENRLAVRLLDHLCLFLARRIRRLREIQQMLSDVSDFGGQMRGSIWLRRRISTLWGNAAQSSGHLKAAEERVRILTRLRAQLLGLMDTQLYVQVPRLARIRGTIRITNILRNDPNYRFVATLWQKWFESGEEQEKTQDEYRNYMISLHERHSDVMALLLSHALDQLGFSEVLQDADITQSGSEVVLRRCVQPQYELKVISARDGSRTITLQYKEIPILRVVPIFFGFLDMLNDKSAKDVRNFLNLERERNIPSVIVYPGSPSRSILSAKVQQDFLFDLKPPPASGNSIQAIPVSPYDIASVERLARCIRWCIWSCNYLKYPASALHRSCMKTITEFGLEGISKLAFRCPEHNDMSIRNLLSAEDFQIKFKRLLEVKGKLKTMSSAVDSLAQAITFTRSLCICPVCMSPNSDARNLKLRDNDTFEMICNECKTKWELGICGNCHSKYPYIAVDGLEKYLPDNRLPGWEEMSLGQDMLAKPIRRNGDISFLCPWCGED